jgi:hypothetical protein
VNILGGVPPSDYSVFCHNVIHCFDQRAEFMTQAMTKICISPNLNAEPSGVVPLPVSPVPVCRQTELACHDRRSSINAEGHADCDLLSGCGVTVSHGKGAPCLPTASSLLPPHL